MDRSAGCLPRTTSYDILVNFSESHDNYYNAYKYITKSDTEVFQCDGHPDLSEVGSPRTKKLTKAYRQSKKRASAEVEQQQPCCSNTELHKKPKRLSNFDVSEFLVKNNLQTRTELLTTENEQKHAGKTDLASFVLFRSSKSASDFRNVPPGAMVRG